MIKKILPGFLLLASQSLAANDAVLSISDAWVREPPPGSRMISAYLSIENHSSIPRTLLEVSSTEFSHVMLHKSEVIKGIAKMSHVNKLEIPANGIVKLSPGSFHLMMPAPDRFINEGMVIPFILSFDQNTSISIEAKVVKP